MLFSEVIKEEQDIHLYNLKFLKKNLLCELDKYKGDLKNEETKMYINREIKNIIHKTVDHHLIYNDISYKFKEEFTAFLESITDIKLV